MYLEQLTELSAYLKKNFAALTLIDFDQMVSLLQSTVKLWNLLPSIQDDFNLLSGASPGSNKQTIFLAKISETIKMAEDFLDTQLQSFEQRMDKLDKSSLTPSTIEEVTANLNKLHKFYDTAIGVSQSMIFMSVDSLLYPLRPFASLARRLKSEKSTPQSLVVSLRLYSKLSAVAQSRTIARSAKSFIEKLVQHINENVDLLLKSAITKVEELSSKEKADFRKEIARICLEPTVSNPIFYSLSAVVTLKDRDQKASFLDSLLSQVVKVGMKYSPGQDEYFKTIEAEARPVLTEFLGIESPEIN